MGFTKVQPNLQIFKTYAVLSHLSPLIIPLLLYGELRYGLVNFELLKTYMIIIFKNFQYLD
ncbi:hypothetical protein GXM_04232 [Nostoc sphaeroides CCNUC1]|uniref:Uncharacterized protein n=1 Tax=Nostoc sphaeroides CCNUC1 TaxID=2653204 RepID=A0A5P8W2C7_9NOSO|nr:hypothetical protein GXM_04232 [Nostoc sphaeroides CCNUC1]